jgi:hypothetical protein
MCRLARIAPLTAQLREEEFVTASDISGHALERALCIIVLGIIVSAVIYAAWISIDNFSRIHV